MADASANETVLTRPIGTLLRELNDFWVVAGATDCSYEEGVRGAAFKRGVARCEAAGFPEPLLAELRAGVNGNLKATLERQNRPAIGHVVRTMGNGQDLAWAAWGGGGPAKVEVKLVFDCTGPA
jgi:hypothetical protein